MRDSTEPVLHLAHPRPVSAAFILGALAKELAVPIISLSEWVDRLEKSAMEFGAGREGVARFIRNLMGGTGQAKERQEQASDRELQARGRMSGKIQKYQNRDHHSHQGYVMLPSKHRSQSSTAGVLRTPRPVH